MKFIVKRFDELTKEELYEILRVRSQVFISQMKMICQDIDGVDFDAFHFYLEEDGKIVAYLRAYYVDDKTLRIGRVLAVQQGRGLGAKLMKQSIAHIKESIPSQTLCLDSQKHAIGFYEKLGFLTVSDEFWEEGVLHVKMERSNF